MNKSIIEEFENLIYQINYILNNFNLSEKEELKEQFRLKSLENSLNEIKKFNKHLNYEENLKKFSKIKGIGNGTIRRINEINKTGKLSEIVIKKNNKEDFNNLLKVYGIGPKVAFKLLKQGINTIEKLKKAIKDKKVKVNQNIILGLKYYKSLKENISREEIKEHKIILKSTLEKIIKSNKLQENSLFIKLCGSYRRKNKTLNDIDCLLVVDKEKCKKNINWLNVFVNELKKINYIVDSLTNNQTKKYMGFVKHTNNNVIRLDIRYIDIKYYPFALMYFTGNKKFNLFMRNKAQDLGFKLNEYGLFKNDKKVKKEFKTEKDIFNILNIKYLKPNQRNF